MKVSYHKGFRPLSRYIGLYPWMKYIVGEKPVSFRPLSRYIGLYLSGNIAGRIELETFPSPLEVYRFISGQ